MPADSSLAGWWAENTLRHDASLRSIHQSRERSRPVEAFGQQLTVEMPLHLPQHYALLNLSLRAHSDIGQVVDRRLPSRLDTNLKVVPCVRANKKATLTATKDGTRCHEGD